MALTFTRQSLTRLSNRWQTVTKVDMDTYATGGESVTANNLSLDSIEAVTSIEATGGYVPVWDSANSKIVMYYADYDAVADGALIQVASDVDLAAVDVTITAIGT